MAVFLCLNSNSRAELYDPTYSQPLQEQEVCDLVEANSQLSEKLQNFKDQKDSSSTADLWYGNYRTEKRTNHCSAWYVIEYTRYQTRSGGGDPIEKELTASVVAYGTITTGLNCDINGEFSHMSDDRCWNPDDLAERDSCPEDGSMPSLPRNAGSNGTTCFAQPDGSRCAYSPSSNGNTLEYDSSLSCYEYNFQEYEPPTSEPPEPNQCQTITSGNTTSTFCPAERDAVCPNGLCQPSCGSFDIGYGEVFGCFSDPNDNVCDQNNDGIIDDSCLAPPLSCEDDPNQPHCPTSPEPVNCAENPDHEYCQNPPSSCEENPTQEGCGTTEPPTTEPPTDTFEGLEQIRGEQQKTNELLTGVKSGIDGVKSEVKGVKTSVDKLTEEQKKTTQATQEVGGAIVGLKNTLNNTGGVSMGITPSDGLNGWYDSEYPEGFTSVMETVTPLYQASKMNQYLDSWKVSVAGEYSFPQICMDIGIANFGCHSLEIDNRVFPFIRIIMIVSALFLARQLVFGG